MRKLKRLKRNIPLCECGCGKEVKNRFIFGHNRKYTVHSEEVRKKISESNKGRKLSKEHKKKLSKSHKGKILSEETKKKMSESHKGKSFSEEHRKKISELHKGKKHSEETKKKISKSKKGQIPWMKGKIQSEESRIKQSCSMQDINRKEWNGFFIHGIYCDVWSDKEYKESIKERDNYQCQNNIDCKKNSKRLGLHHIDYDKKNCKPENIITVCTSCNTRANFNKEYWKEFYNNIMEKK